jgi:2-polyprenyl-3-methyl-5-hydroxy-6-metoxy-1,4-benzoquinol methylase
MGSPTGRGQEQHSKSEWPSDGLERVDRCPVCGVRDRKLLHEDLRDEVFFCAPGAWRLYSCSGCSSGYLDPRPDLKTIGLAYSTYYTHGTHNRNETRRSPRAALGSRLSNGYLNVEYGCSFDPAWTAGRWLIPAFPRRRSRADRQIRHLKSLSSPSRLLDVGCGNGDFLAQMKDCGWIVHGIDPDPVAVRRARDRGVPVDEGFLTNDMFSHGDFDAVTLNHVVEHMHDPLEAFRNCWRILRPGGVLWIETPNLASAGYALFGRNWRGLEPPRHLVLFTTASLIAALRRIGFVVSRQASSSRAGSSFASSAAISERTRVEDTSTRIPRALPYRARVADLRSLWRPDVSEDIVVVAEKPNLHDDVLG